MPGLDFLQQLAQARPDPGGGAAAACGAALGLALVVKVVRLERRRPRINEERRLFWQQQEDVAHRLAVELENLRNADVEAYRELARAMAGRFQGEAWLAAVTQAIDVPHGIAGGAREGLNLTAVAGEHCQPHLISDLLVACEFFVAAAQGAYHIAAANLPLLATAADRERYSRRLDETLEQVREDGRQTIIQLKSRVSNPEPRVKHV